MNYTPKSIQGVYVPPPVPSEQINKNTTQLNDMTNQKISFNTKTGLIKYRAALAKLKAGTLDVVDVCVLGDSITEGWGCTPGKYLTNSWVGRLRTALANRYGDVGTGFIPCYFPCDDREVANRPWSLNGFTTTMSFFTLGGFEASTVGATATMSFIGVGISIMYLMGVSGSSFTYSIDGGTPQTVSTYSATYKAGRTEITGLTSGVHTILITKIGTGTLYLVGAHPITGTKGVRVHMLGHGGNQSSTYSASSAGSYMMEAIDIWQAPLYILALGANDHVVGVDPTAFKANMQTLITRCKNAGGDVLLVSAGIDKYPGKKYPQGLYRDALQDLAMENNVAFVDVFNRWGGDASIPINLGLMSDVVHPNDAGHIDTAAPVISVLVESDDFNGVGSSNNTPSQPTTYSVNLSCEFLHTVCAPWFSAALGNGGLTAVAGTPKHPGIATYLGGTTANSGIIIRGASYSLLLAGGEKTTFIFKAPSTLTGVTRRTGFIDSTSTADATNGAYVEIIDGVLKGKTATGGVYSTTASTFPIVANTWYRLVIELNSNATSVSFTIFADDSDNIVWRDTLTTNIPTATGKETGHADICFYSGTTAITIGYLDYVSLYLPNTRKV